MEFDVVSSGPLQITSPEVPLGRIPRKEESTRFDGPISGPMWEKVSRLGSAFPDSFDYTIYDKLADRFSSATPLGGVVFKTPLKLVNYHSSCTRCHYAFEMDTYGRGCIHECVYCYAKEQLTTRGYWNRPIPFPVDIGAIRKIFYTVFETEKSSKWRTILSERIPLRLGGMSEPFMWMDRKYKVAIEVLKILDFYSYPYIIFTRSDLLAEPDYLRVLNPELACIQMSVCGGNEQLTRQLEPGSPSPIRRLKALATLNKNGFWTAVRLNPFFPMHPDGYFTDKKSVKRRFGNLEDTPRFPLFDWDFLDRVKETGTPTVLAGFVRLSRPGLNNIVRETGIDLKRFFRPELMRDSKHKCYSDNEIAFYYTRLKSECAARGLRFTTCYIGNGQKDYYQYQALWDNKLDCCDVRGNLSAFKKSSQEIEWSERLRHAPVKDCAKQFMNQDQENDLRYSTDLSRAPRKSPQESPLGQTSL